MACPRKVATTAPTIPRIVVRMKPRGLGPPGVTSLAMTPAKNPTMMAQTISMTCLRLRQEHGDACAPMQDRPRLAKRAFLGSLGPEHTSARREFLVLGVRHHRQIEHALQLRCMPEVRLLVLARPHR